MSKQLNVPTQLRKVVENQDSIEVQGDTIMEVICEVDARYNGIKERLVSQTTGQLNKFVLIFVNDEDIRFLQNENTKLKDGDVITLVPSIAGG